MIFYLILNIDKLQLLKIYLTLWYKIINYFYIKNEIVLYHNTIKKQQQIVIFLHKMLYFIYFELPYKKSVKFIKKNYVNVQRVSYSTI